jgi:hypothetical protein
MQPLPLQQATKSSDMNTVSALVGDATINRSGVSKLQTDQLQAKPKVSTNMAKRSKILAIEFDSLDEGSQDRSPTEPKLPQTRAAMRARDYRPNVDDFEFEGQALGPTVAHHDISLEVAAVARSNTRKKQTLPFSNDTLPTSQPSKMVRPLTCAFLLRFIEVVTIQSRRRTQFP